MKCGTGPLEYAERAGAGRGRSARAHAAAHNMHMHMHMRTVHVSHEQSERREAEAGEGRHCADRVAQQVSLLLLEKRGQVGGGALHFECRASSCLPGCGDASASLALAPPPCACVEKPTSLPYLS